MPSNVEIKAVLSEPDVAHAIAERLSDTRPETIHQEDVFFRCTGSRLKLRILGAGRGELIRYERADIADARCSHYVIARTPDPEVLHDILKQALGVTGVVKKVRTLYLVGQTRIHIDRVQGLGNFLEMEVMLRTDQNEIEGKRIAAALLAEFGIEGQQLIGEAYVDLLARQA